MTEREMTMPNAELAYRVLDEINAHREHFSMSQWAGRDGRPGSDLISLADLTAPEASCGTTACFAGWVVVLSGLRLTGNGRVYDGDRLVGRAESYATDLLGLDAYETNDLFFVPDDAIEGVVKEIFGDRPDGAA